MKLKTLQAQYVWLICLCVLLSAAVAATLFNARLGSRFETAKSIILARGMAEQSVTWSIAEQRCETSTAHTVNCRNIALKQRLRFLHCMETQFDLKCCQSVTYISLFIVEKCTKCNKDMRLVMISFYPRL